LLKDKEIVDFNIKKLPKKRALKKNCYEKVEAYENFNKIINVI